jgi:hypothetical protein
MNYLDSFLRVETLSFKEAADFNPRGDSIFLMAISPAATAGVTQGQYDTCHTPVATLQGCLVLCRALPA